MGQLFTAFGAGVLSFFSPCILPLLPAYLSMLSGFSAREIMNGAPGVSTHKIARRAAIFIAGFTLAFSVMGAAASGLGSVLAAHKELMLRLFGAAMVLLGVHMTGILNLTLLNYEKRFSMRHITHGPVGALLMGFAFALGWSPCIGPILAVILGLAAATGTLWKGVALLLAYSAGLAVPLMAAALLTARFFSLLARFRGGIRWVEMAAGVTLIIFGALLFADKLMFVI
ncbi:MAG TPA: cytochrome c biogenesis protein CcdA [Elusimicrobiales bacterium]|nr:cytochrome c biogenesis protein CcdA [Elusimicrobiales bacterium]